MRVGLLAVALLYCATATLGISVWEDITLTSREKYALDKFKLLVNNTLPYEYMMEDIYLIKWLRFKKLNLRESQKALMKHLNWRKENRMDTIVEEDFGDVEFEYPYGVNGFDYEGRPVMTLNAAEWDIRKALLQGKRDKLVRWSFRAYEIASRKVRELQKDGKNVTQFIMLCNFDGFNIVQHACLQCVEVMVNFLAAYEVNYPGMADSIYGINTPQSFQVVFNALKAVMTKDTRDVVQIFGTNKDVWKKVILKKIPEDQLEPEFGGTRYVWNNIR